jgi:uncharacterized protein YeeX (DUF496 family)
MPKKKEVTAEDIIQEIRDNQEKIDELLNNLEDKILEGQDPDFDDEEFEEDEDDQ